ncbi:ankyrin repeat domain-containing protein [Candidatus Chromulinivorax destructor]|uniref:Uncharacterized protein n=1 Tax=Candidatus Chromulinivorax destructor TaxID=2066483 RepID=A0A345ZCV2_9BACT|nr:ankyrin repeat domain-containing protein [Candidatus Chromulinivorax destructor]AXK61119.1 hypothetical protein C0J27_05300 [Candidatus Chromulinivorax destructor]
MNIKYLLIISLLSTYQCTTCSGQELTSQPEELVRQNEEFITWSISAQKPLVEFYNSLHQDDPKIPYLQDIVKSNLEYHGEYDIVWPKLFDHATYIALHKDAYDLHNHDLYIYDHPNFKPVVQEYEVVINPEENYEEVHDINFTEDQLQTYNYIIENYKYLITGFQLVSNYRPNTQNSFEFFLKKAVVQEDFDPAITIHTAQQYIAERMKQQFLTVLEHAIENNIPLSAINDSIFLYVVSYQHDFMKFFICTWIEDTYHLSQGFNLVYKSEYDLTFKNFQDLLSDSRFNIITGTQKAQQYIAEKMERNFLAVAQRMIHNKFFINNDQSEPIKKDPVFSYIMADKNNFMKKFIDSWIDKIPAIKKYVTLHSYHTIIRANDSDAFLLLLYLQDNYADDADQEKLKISNYLITASQNGSLDIVVLLLRQQNIAINEQNSNGITPLIAAIQSGNLEIVSLLLSVPGIDTEIANRNKWTPLYIAIFKNNPAMVKLLLDAGAHHHITIHNETLLDIATRKGYTQIVEFLTQAQNNA